MLLLEHSAILLTCIINLSDVIISLENQFLVFFLSSCLRQVLLLLMIWMTIMATGLQSDQCVISPFVSGV